MQDAILTVAVVPVALTAHSPRDGVRSPTLGESRAAAAAVERWSTRARRDRGQGWVYGSDELYLLAGLPFPPAEAYDGFAQVENGVGAVRHLERLMAADVGRLPELAGRRILVCTGTAMGPLMPSLLSGLERATGATFQLQVLENSYYGASVTTAGLLPGQDFQRALAGRAHCALALLPAEAVNDEGVFVDDVAFASATAAAPMPVRISYHFTDALSGALAQ
jgi:NifB/MoaA-like Fe-S oxidoreductase